MFDKSMIEVKYCVTCNNILCATALAYTLRNLIPVLTGFYVQGKSQHLSIHFIACCEIEKGISPSTKNKLRNILLTQTSQVPTNARNKSYTSYILQDTNQFPFTNKQTKMPNEYKEKSLENNTSELFILMEIYSFCLLCMATNKKKPNVRIIITFPFPSASFGFCKIKTRRE